MQDKEKYTLLGNYPEHEVDIVESLLKSSGIPTIRKYPETGGYLEIYMGYNAFGIDIYVPSTMIKEARNILQSDKKDIKIDNKNSIQKRKTEEKSCFHNIRSIMKLILLLIIILNVSFIVYSALKILINLLF